MDITERMTFQSAFSLELWTGERVSIFSKKNHCDAFSKTSRCLWKIIAMSLPNHWENFFLSLGRLFLHLSEEEKNSL
jgi:hypothetical protein